MKKDKQQTEETKFKKNLTKPSEEKKKKNDCQSY